ncbi:MAG: OsmC family protein [Paracoccaceae bacterium]|nr:OsmC family protein [Paracoccaceae bacterium]
MKSRIAWVADHAYTAQTEDGHAITVGTAHGDSPKPGPSAMELVLMGAGSCASWDVVEILRKSRQDITDVTCDLEADRAPEPPKVFTRIHLHFTVTGSGVDERRVARAVELSVGKYCSALKMIEKSAEITHEFDVVEVA